MRLFVAINFNNEIKSSLNNCIIQLKKQGIRGKFSQLQNLHLTLAFIGETNRISEAKKIVNSVKFWPFNIVLEGSGAFRDVLWVGVEKSPTLNAIVDELSLKLHEVGLISEIREFKPHITIARQVPNADKLALQIQPASMTVNDISLMQSRHINGQLVYSRIN